MNNLNISCPTHGVSWTWNETKWGNVNLRGLGLYLHIFEVKVRFVVEHLQQTNLPQWQWSTELLTFKANPNQRTVWLFAPSWDVLLLFPLYVYFIFNTLIFIFVSSVSSLHSYFSYPNWFPFLSKLASIKLSYNLASIDPKLNI